MKLQLMAIHDKALGAFMRPFYTQSVGQAVRMFEDLANEPGQDVNKHPGDYDLYHLGTWDDANGKTTELETPLKLTNAGPLTRAQKDDELLNKQFR